MKPHTALRNLREILIRSLLFNFLIVLELGKQFGHQIMTDFANLKHLHDELSAALKAHETTQQKKLEKIFH